MGHKKPVAKVEPPSPVATEAFCSSVIFTSNYLLIRTVSETLFCNDCQPLCSPCPLTALDATRTYIQHGSRHGFVVDSWSPLLRIYDDGPRKARWHGSGGSSVGAHAIGGERDGGRAWKGAGLGLGHRLRSGLLYFFNKIFSYGVLPRVRKS
jgi:hypothetical protein